MTGYGRTARDERPWSPSTTAASTPLVPRQFDGSLLSFEGMAADIELAKHQKDGAARIVFGGNSPALVLRRRGQDLHHGRRIPGAQEDGVCLKAAVLCAEAPGRAVGHRVHAALPAGVDPRATDADFEKDNRKRFVARIAAGDWDAVIVSETQLAKIPLPPGAGGPLIEEEKDQDRGRHRPGEDV